MQRPKTKDTVIGLLVLIGLAGVCFSGYTLFNHFKVKYQSIGYGSALQDMVQASESNRELTVTVGDKTVKFVVVTPTSETPTLTPAQ